jgi:hypothetical protein
MELAFLFFYKIEIKMATIAKGSITLVNVNDAYSVLFTPDSCAIKADFDGTNPDLTNAYTDITVVRGEEKHTFKLTLASFSNTAITYQQIAIDAYTKRIRLTSIPSDVLSGALTFTITTDDEFVADVTFTYSVIRETSMLDWILDWESNKTVIGDSYLISPKIFVGKKVENAEGLKTLTGVYIGPDDTNTAGIYGYKEGKDVFHINAKGAMLGGWNVLSDCITTSNDKGTISLGADGNIFYRTNKNELVWALFQDGSATFAKGNVMLNSDGSAIFAGSIKSSSGIVGGWTIDEEVLYNANIALNSAEHIIGVGGANSFDVNNIKGSVQRNGGVYMFYDNANSYGLQGYLPRKSVGDNLYMIQCSFSLGSTNQIANWNFDEDSLYMGAKVNMQKKYTASSGDITIGSQGMRGNSWYIDTDGSVSFLKGEVQFTESSGSMVGWNLNAKRLSNPNVAIVSDTANAGIFMSVANGTDFNSLASSSLTDYIDTHGGIYMKIKTDGVSFAAYDQNGYKIFKLRSNGVSSIADWNIENDALFVGSKKVDAGSFTDAAGSMTFSSTGIRGNKWRLEADGSGAIAGGKINWDKAGNIVVDAKISANNITAGTISTASIRNQSDTWYLNQDGSGALAGNKLTWNKDGVLRVQNSRLTNVIIDGAIKTPFRDGQYVLGDDGPITFSTIGLQNNNNVVIPGAGNGWNLSVIIPFDIKYNGFRAIIMNDDWGSEVAGGAWSVEAPSGKYFYENGIAKKTLLLMPYTGVEMIGYGDANTFKGWIILNRIEKAGNKGFPLHVCFCGIVKDGQLAKIKKYNEENITVSKLSKGIYRFTFGQPWSSVDNYMVFLTGQAENAGRYASIYQKTTTYFDVYCGDDETPNDGDFQFMVVNVSSAYLT